ncbi:hypothetical protein JRO89_XS02G0027400 [Xanthoceras sorbifolium]|uniref:Uncharacterized protein n=1 Tax=Xanthoceras sorbifolium TaxID=99658 RepID=A0ABQ8IE47_9ROSI|nr:hypothetical protein JRO89_XS02G0027400 [Xanthoceras sorbifolium]
MAEEDCEEKEKWNQLVSSKIEEEKKEGKNGDDAVVRRCSKASPGDDSASISTVSDVGGGGRGCSGPVRAGRQEDEEREEIQRIVWQFEAEEREDDRAHQGQSRGPQEQFDDEDVEWFIENIARMVQLMFKQTKAKS